MKKRILFILVLILVLSAYSKVYASEMCSAKGYSIFTVNGIFTDKEKAAENKRALERKLLIKTYHNEPLSVDFLYNPTHLAGVGDFVDAIQQGLFDQKSDYDLVEILNDASRKVTTQKLLLIAHSQGNFYANNFYDKVASKEGGIPRESIGVYGVASPAGWVAGSGKYLTSSTDSLINDVRKMLSYTLQANVDIKLEKDKDGNGHSFSDVYLKYQGDRIVSDIKSSLDRLKENDEQISSEPCISAQELTLGHKIVKGVLAVADPVANIAKKKVTNIYDTGSYLVKGLRNAGLAIGKSLKGLSANVIETLPDSGGMTTVVVDVLDHPTEPKTASTEDNPSQKTLPSPLPKTEEIIVTPTDIPDASDTSPRSHGGGRSSSTSESESELTLPQTEDPVLPPPTIDIIPPIVTILGNNPESVVVGTVYVDAGATAFDDIDGTRDIVSTGVVDFSVVGVYTITYTSADLSNNIATATRTVNVVAVPPPVKPQDITIPVISIIGDSFVNITIGNVYTDAGATALDDVDGVCEVVVNGVSDVNTEVVGTYVITYTAIDLSGNIANTIRTVNVVAPPPPPLATFTIDKNTTLSAGEYNYDNLIITNNAILTLEGNPESTDDFKGVKINAVNLTITEGASISADQKGYGPNKGPGAVQDTSGVSNPGAGYGGASSGAQNAVTYGSATEPIDLGSGGASLNRGGGAIYIVVSDTVTNDGIISSSGGASSSGGSIYVKALKIKGEGIFRANGGDLFASGYFKSPGGGGRVALYYDDWSFDGIVEAKGGCGSYDSYTKVCSGDGTAGAFDVPENDIYAKGSWKFLEDDSPFNFNHIFLSGAQIEIEDGVDITADDIVLDRASVLVLSGEEIINVDNLLVTGNSIITVVPEKILSLIISNITVDSGSMISADEKGYMNGPGTEETFTAGASYGGKGGGATAKPSYGSDTEPTDFGSGNQGRRGGGAIYLEVENNLENNGIISANGTKERVSGGSIYVRADEISGSGIFQAKGGNSSWPYGPTAGSGGRIAMYYNTLSFSGTTNVLGGVYCFSGCNPAAQPGTLVLVDESIVADPEEPDPELSSLKVITTFNFTNLIPEIVGVVNEAEHTISATVPFGTSVATLIPTITISELASINPNNNIVQDFSNPITYTVTAEDNSTQDYVVTVVVEAEPEPDPEPVTTPSIISYSFNGAEDNVTINSLADVTSMVFTANKNIDWVSIKIEKEDDASIFKSLRESTDCADGTKTCSKTWNTLLAGDTTAPNGTYKVKVRIRDLSDDTKDYDFFSPYTITINIPEDAPIALE